MCNVLLKDPNNFLWQMSIDDNGRLATTKQSFTVNHFAAPLLYGGSKIWQLSADINGRVISTVVPPVNILVPPSYISMQAPGGIYFKVTFSDYLQRLVTTSAVGKVLDIIPYQPNVVMSRWPDSIGVTCPGCNGAVISVSGDLSSWCCVCNLFVPPEDTTLTVVLSE